MFIWCTTDHVLASVARDFPPKTHNTFSLQSLKSAYGYDGKLFRE